MAFGPRAVEDLVTVPRRDFWRGKRVLVTGHTGFKGAWLTYWLSRLGCRVFAVAQPPATEPSLYRALELDQLCTDAFVDIRDCASLTSFVQRAQPEVVFHLAAQALVRASYRAPLDTFSTNVMGTAHVCEAIRSCGSVRSAVVVTTDKVYLNREWPYPYREEDPLGGYDPYSASKAACEIVVAGYRSSFLRQQGVSVATARAGNVIGGGDWSEDRLIPDAVRAWQSGTSLSIRNPNAIRPWQHVLEPIGAYIRLADVLWDRPDLACAYNFGPDTNEAATVGNVVALASEHYGNGAWTVQQDSAAVHEAGWLALEVAFARVKLDVMPRWGLSDSVRRTMNWYRRYSEGEAARQLCDIDIRDFEESR